MSTSITSSMLACPGPGLDFFVVVSSVRFSDINEVKRATLVLQQQQQQCHAPQGAPEASDDGQRMSTGVGG